MVRRLTMSMLGVVLVAAFLESCAPARCDVRADYCRAENPHVRRYKQRQRRGRPGRRTRGTSCTD